MRLIEVIPCGPLAALYPKIKLRAATAAEAIEGWSVQVAKAIPEVIEAVGFPSAEKLYAKLRVRKIYVYPAMFGGGGNFAKILLGAALVAMAFIPGANIFALSATMLATAGSLGVGLLLGGMMGLFMKTPSVSKDKDPPPSKYIGSGGNSTSIGTPIGIGAGRMLVGGQYLSIQVNATDLVYGTFPATPT